MTMSDFRDKNDLRPRDPDARLRDPDPLAPASLRPEPRGFGTTWGSILGAVVLAIIVAFVFSAGEDASRTAQPTLPPPVGTATNSSTTTTTPMPRKTCHARPAHRRQRVRARYRQIRLPQRPVKVRRSNAPRVQGHSPAREMRAGKSFCVIDSRNRNMGPREQTGRST